MTVEVDRGACPLCPDGTPSTFVTTGRDFEYGTTDQEFTVVACDVCGTWFLDPRPADGDIGSLYPPEYEPYHFDELPPLVRRARDLTQSGKARALRRYAPDDGVILDLGCGGGALLRLLRSRGPAGWRLIGWDFPGPHLDRLAGDGFEVIASPIDIEHSPEHVADLVILNQVIEHFARPDELLRIVDRALKPGGVVFIETPDVDGLDARLFRYRHWGGYHFPRHLVLFTNQSLQALLRREGFSTVETKRLASPAFWTQSVHHRLAERQPDSRFAKSFTLRNPVVVAAATATDMVTRLVHPTSNQRVVARHDGP